MNMNGACAVLFLNLIWMTGANGSIPVANPVADYMVRHADDIKSVNGMKEHIVKIEMDVNNDGSTDVLVSKEKSGLLTQSYKNRVYSWDLYLGSSNGTFLLMDLGKVRMNSTSQEILSGQSLTFDPEKFHLGYSAQAQAFGILAVYYLPAHNGVQFSLFVVRANSFENLNIPDSSRPAEIYHRDDSGNIPDLAESLKPYLLISPTMKMEVLP